MFILIYIRQDVALQSFVKLRLFGYISEYTYDARTPER